MDNFIKLAIVNFLMLSLSQGADHNRLYDFIPISNSNYQTLQTSSSQIIQLEKMKKIHPAPGGGGKSALPQSPINFEAISSCSGPIYNLIDLDSNKIFPLSPDAECLNTSLDIPPYTVPEDFSNLGNKSPYSIFDWMDSVLNFTIDERVNERTLEKKEDLEERWRKERKISSPLFNFSPEAYDTISNLDTSNLAERINIMPPIK